MDTNYFFEYTGDDYIVYVGMDVIGYVWFDVDSETWVSTEIQGEWGTDGHESRNLAADYLYYA